MSALRWGSGIGNEWRGNWRPKPGSILSDGRIVTDPRYHFIAPAIRSGVIFIERRRLGVAMQYGWKPARAPMEPGPLVSVIK